MVGIRRADPPRTCTQAPRRKRKLPRRAEPRRHARSPQAIQPNLKKFAEYVEHGQNTDKKHQGLREIFPKPLISWLRGLDLNQRPLGYEPFAIRHHSQRATNNTS